MSYKTVIYNYDNVFPVQSLKCAFSRNKNHSNDTDIDDECLSLS